MKHETRRNVVLIGCLLVLAVSSLAADEAPELELGPCTIELVDGTKVEGQLAVQFDMPDHLIVYSPRLATVRSFLKGHVHALTVDGKREQLNAKRALTDEDKKLLGQVEWPDEPPAKGHQPAYTTEKWDRPKVLVVWANPGKSGVFDEPGNWLVNGKPAGQLGASEVWSGPAWGRKKGLASFDPATDILIPVADRGYQVRSSGAGSYLARHITVESNGFLSNNLSGVYGNLWVSEAGGMDGGGCAFIRGDRHSFFVNGRRREDNRPVDWGKIKAKHFARKWIVRKDAIDASVELIGSVGSGDETHIVRGRAIISENSTVLIGPRCCQTVRREATLQLTSGAVIAKNGNQLHKQDMLIGGLLLAGTPERPLESDCYIGISFKDHEALFAGDMWKKVGKARGFVGFEVVAGGQIRVHSTDPTKARLVFTCHRQDGAGDTGSVPGEEKNPQLWQAYRDLPRRINMVFWKQTDLQFDGVLFEDIEEGGIKMEDPSMKDSWRNVFYGKNNAAAPEKIYVQHTPKVEGRGAYSFPIKTVVKGGMVGGHTLFAQTEGTPIVVTPEGCYRRGETVMVKLTTESRELEIRYTLDGSEPTAKSQLYKGPFPLKQDAVLKAASFKGEEKQGDTAVAEFKFVSPDRSQLLDSVAPTGTSPGLSYKYYEGNWDQVPDFDNLTPKETGVAAVPTPEAVKRRASRFGMVFEGFFEVGEEGLYSLQVRTAKEDDCHVYVDDQAVLLNNRKELRTNGLVGLKAGKHRLKVVFVDTGWGAQIVLKLRKLGQPEEREVTAEMFSH